MENIAVAGAIILLVGRVLLKPKEADARQKLPARWTMLVGEVLILLGAWELPFFFWAAVLLAIVTVTRLIETYFGKQGSSSTPG